MTSAPAPGLAEAGDTQGRLGRHVKQRRLRLRLSVRAAARLANIDRATWASMENGSRRVAAYNHAGVERALEWEPGSIESVLNGGEPDAQSRRIGRPATGPTPSRSIRLSDEDIAAVDRRAAEEAEGERSEMIRRLLAYATPRMPKNWKPNPDPTQQEDR